MEGDDGTITRVPLYIIKNVVRRHPFRVVAGDEIPHDDLVLPAEPGILCQSHPTVGRTDVAAVDIGIGLFHVVTVFLDGVSKADDVVVGMVAHLMAFVDDALVEFRVFAYVVTHHEERGLDTELFKSVEDERSRLGDGTVVEGQIDGLLVTVHSPVGFRIKPPQVYGRLLYKHLILLFIPSLRLWIGKCSSFGATVLPSCLPAPC